MNLDLLLNCNIFRGISKEQIQTLLSSLKYKLKNYDKNEVIYRTGDRVTSLGIVMSGSVTIEYYDIWGNKSILDKLSSPQVFGETYACLSDEPIMVDAVATEPAQILLIEIASILEFPHPCCSFHNQLVKNLLIIAAQKNLVLSHRIFHTSSKSIRSRILSFLSFQAKKRGKLEFSIAFDRQQLADYLNVDRSALSNEISKMQKEGIIKVNKNHFVILKELME